MDLLPVVPNARFGRPPSWKISNDHISGQHILRNLWSCGGWCHLSQMVTVQGNPRSAHTSSPTGLLLLLGAESGSAYSDTLRGVSICMSSLTLVYPAKAVGPNETPFGRDTRVVPRHCSNIIQLLMAPGPLREAEIWGSEPPFRSAAA